MPADNFLTLVNSLEKQPDYDIRQQIEDIIRELINSNFSLLVELLYRVDIDEKKLKQLLKPGTDVDAPSVIADLIIKRQLQKAAARRQFSKRNKPLSDDSW